MRHKWKINSLAFSPDGELLASCSNDKTVAIWQLHDEVKILWLHCDIRVSSVRFSPDGKYLATGSYPTAVVWDLHDGRKLAEFHHDYWVRSVDFSPDGRYLATGTAGGGSSIWRIPEGEKAVELLHKGSVESVDFSPDGRYLATGTNNWIAFIWRIPEGEKAVELLYDHDILSVRFSPDGRYLGSDTMIPIVEWRNHKKVLTAHEDNIWSVSWFKRFPAWYVFGKGAYSPFAELHEKNISCMDTSRRGFLAIGDYNGLIEVIREGKDFINPR